MLHKVVHKLCAYLHIHELQTHSIAAFKGEVEILYSQGAHEKAAICFSC